MTSAEIMTGLSGLHVPTWTQPDEADLLWRLASVAPGEVVELGCFCGYATAVMAAAAESPVTTVDPFPVHWWRRWVNLADDLPCERTIEIAERAWSALGLTDRIRVIVAECETPQAAEQVPQEIGLLYVDADHEAEPLATQLAMYLPRIVPGGCVAYDDWTSDVWPVREVGRAAMAAGPFAWRWVAAVGKLSVWQRYDGTP